MSASTLLGMTVSSERALFVIALGFGERMPARSLLSKVCQLGDVALNSRNVGADCLHGLVEFLLATARYEDIGTLFDEKFCRSEPNPFCSAGDDGGLAFELFGHCLSPLLLSWDSPAPMLHVQSLEPEHRLAEVIGQMICAAQ